MKRSSIDIGVELARLEPLDVSDLRETWRRVHQTPPPPRLSRDLLLRGIAYRLQERAIGGLSRSSLRRLQRGNEESEAAFRRQRPPRVSLKPGTRLMREWHGITHTVVILDDGIEWRGQCYRSLSVVAREITGAHWSGPRFFGLRAGASDG